MTQYDLLVIGAGSGGVRCARIAAKHGARVAIIEGGHWGGTCVNIGCVPKKLMFYAALAGRNLNHASSFGWEVGQTLLDWKIFNAKRNAEISRLENIYQTLLEKSGVDLYRGWASFENGDTVKVTPNGFSDGHLREPLFLKARNIVVAVGGAPYKLPIEGADLALVSDDMFNLPENPRDMVILGGGYIGVEFAGIMAGLGTRVDLCYRADLPLRGFDQDLRERAAQAFEVAGVHAHPGYEPVKIELADGKKRKKVHFSNGEIIECDSVLMATGRKPLLNGLDVERAGIETERGRIVTDSETFETNVANIYAIGDVTDRLNLTPVAIAEGQMLADRLFDNDRGPKWDFANVPKAVFAYPPLASVGLSEQEAISKFDVNIYETQFSPMSEALWSTGKTKIFMKLVVDAQSDKLLGAHMIGEEAPDTIQLMATMIDVGITKKQLDSTVALHPCSAEEMVTMRSLTRFCPKKETA